MSEINAVICSFSSGLDDMNRKDQKDARKVLAVLKECGRFSVFEATANAAIASTLDYLGNEEFYKHTGGSYPWCEIEITPKGEELLAQETKQS